VKGGAPPDSELAGVGARGRNSPGRVGPPIGPQSFALMRRSGAVGRLSACAMILAGQKESRRSTAGATPFLHQNQNS
jgi:hypothetical protein